MHRFFVDPTLLKDWPATATGPITLPESTAHQVRDVLHLGLHERLLLLDNSGAEFEVQIVRSSRASVDVELVALHAARPEPSVRIVLCQGLLKSARFEWILEKGTELGVTTFLPLQCRRSQAGLEEVGAAKLQRWRRIIQEAAEQSGRSRLPELATIQALPQALSALPSSALALMPWEEAHDLTMRSALRTEGKFLQVPLVVYLFIGPEGGLTREEVLHAQDHGVRVVTLGPRILRAETAALATIANVMYELELR